MLLLSIGALVLGVLLFNNREILKGRTKKHAEAAQALAEKLTAGRDPFIEPIDKELNMDNLLNYQQMDGELGTLSSIAGTRLDVLFDTGQDLKNTRDELEATRAELARTKQELADARAEIERLEGVVAEKERQLAEANQRIDTLETEKDSLEEEIEGLNDKVADLEIEIEDKEAEIVSLQTIVDKLRPDDNPEVTDTPKGLKGEVVLVNSDWNFIVVDIGEQDELAPLTPMLVHRGNHLVGKVKASMVDETAAVCEINRDFEQMPIQAGDTVFYPGVN